MVKVGSLMETQHVFFEAVICQNGGSKVCPNHIVKQVLSPSTKYSYFPYLPCISTTGIPEYFILKETIHMLCHLLWRERSEGM